MPPLQSLPFFAFWNGRVPVFRHVNPKKIPPPAQPFCLFLFPLPRLDMERPCPKIFSYDTSERNSWPCWSPLTSFVGLKGLVFFSRILSFFLFPLDFCDTPFPVLPPRETDLSAAYHMAPPLPPYPIPRPNTCALLSVILQPFASAMTEKQGRLLFFCLPSRYRSLPKFFPPLFPSRLLFY